MIIKKNALKVYKFDLYKNKEKFIVHKNLILLNKVNKIKVVLMKGFKFSRIAILNCKKS